ncbi:MULTISPECIES: sensor histidine kinase [Methylosinus]|uniref:histidine kinase n=1 Tax=Methylosinus trichosporium (strain ATCC 35070 / NCIMB 11131 / UNIQEM 75 / OB3b) TaxID=595536 RepID=A0A2D2CZK5_METT3|nr:MULTISPECIES: sensor histidine kinase KdpD [Methylosinus]ATQ68191.1 sensor histidine kinase KdpD [Methylosinus trichosporium OB3b]OBS53457.1 histidine kinase [Methylosinus sp. 3S-1]
MAETADGSERRPDPDALLALAEQEKRGKLRVFLGAAPGVGKTYAMLARAKAAKADGCDIVVGVAETHGRAETLALLDGLESLPRRKIDYRGRALEEFDVDAALARKPRIILVDELAHTNAPDCRHPKRWQDVEELLEAEIDVWTTLNIQHLEGLADIVSRVTGVAVRETVPDLVLQNADDVILVDITPDELLQRLKEGKVYVPQMAERAIRNFFTPRNLTALRELALRRTADRVDDQMVDYLRQSAIEGPWATSERLLVCVGADRLCERVVRAGARAATALNAPWLALHVERPGEEQDPAEGRRVDEALRLAERLGGEALRVSGQDLAAETLRVARRENITQIVVGRSRAGWFARLARKSLTEELVRRSTDIAVQIITDGGAPAEPMRRVAPPHRRFWLGVAAALLSSAVAAGVAALAERWLALPDPSLIFLASVVACALGFGVASATAASIFSFLALDFLFVEPRYDISISEPREFLSLLVFLSIAMVTGTLAGRARSRSEAMRARAEAAQSLFDLSRKLASAANLDDVLWAAANHAQKALEAKSVVLLVPGDADLRIAAAWPPVDELDAGEAGAARWARDKAEPAGWRTDTLPRVRFQFHPLMTTRGVVAVAGIEPRDPSEPLSAQTERMLTAILEQTAVAVDRSLLVGESVRAAALEENERLRTTLLSSLSHDLRTPLAAIIGAVTSLRQLGEKMTAEERADLLASIEEEAGRLSRFVVNLLDMSRIESGALAPRRELVDIGDVVRGALERARKELPRLTVTASLARDLPPIRGDAHLLGQVLFNLLDNAQKYGGGSAAVYARREGGELALSVTDEGPGVKPQDLERIFEKFYRGGRVDGRKAGTGLGLSICRGLVEAMGGAIVAQSPAARRRGTRMLMRFPAAEPRGGA